MKTSRDSSDRYSFELLALRLHVHGLPAIEGNRAIIRGLARSPLWLETRFLLREHGCTDAEVAVLMGIHPKGCACWECVRALYRAVHRSRFGTKKRRVGIR
jgi:hypothetical protein